MVDFLLFVNSLFSVFTEQNIRSINKYHSPRNFQVIFNKYGFVFECVQWKLFIAKSDMTRYRGYEEQIILSRQKSHLIYEYVEKLGETSTSNN